MNIRFQRPWLQSCIQLRKTTCLLSIRKSLACARASKLTTTNMYTARGSGVERAECPLIIGMGYSVQVLAWSLIAQSVCQRVFGLLEIRFQRPCVESCIQQEDYLSPFNSKIACLRPSIEMNNNKKIPVLIFNLRKIARTTTIHARFMQAIYSSVKLCKVQSANYNFANTSVGRYLWNTKPMSPFIQLLRFRFYYFDQLPIGQTFYDFMMPIL